MKETILEARNLVKKYGDSTAVKDVNLAIQEGEILGLLGPNGAGKTTIISMITGLLEPTSGHITVDGLDLQTDTNAVKAKLGLVPQELALYPTLSARDNLSFFGSIYGLGGKDLRGRVDTLLEMVERVRAEGLETCMTLGMLDEQQAGQLSDAGLDYYNHNLDTSPEFYGDIISTRTYQDRLDTIQHVRAAGMHVCCGGIVGMGEARADRASLMEQLACQKPHLVP